jgi:hypothetical protein
VSKLITRAEFDVVFNHWTESKTEHQMDLFYHFYEMGWLDCRGRHLRHGPGPLYQRTREVSQ